MLVWVLFNYSGLDINKTLLTVFNYVIFVGEVELKMVWSNNIHLAACCLGVALHPTCLIVHIHEPALALLMNGSILLIVSWSYLVRNVVSSGRLYIFIKVKILKTLILVVVLVN